MDENKLEETLQAKATAPRVTLERINELSSDAKSFNLGEALRALGMRATDGDFCTTVCIVTTPTDFKVIATSACVSRENFDLQIGHEIALKKCRDQMWALEGYVLKEKLAARAHIESAIAEI